MKLLEEDIHISFIKKSYNKIIVSALVNDYSVHLNGSSSTCSCSEENHCVHVNSLKNHLNHYLHSYLDHIIKPYALHSFLKSSLNFPDNKKKLPLKSLTFYSLEKKKFFFQPKVFFTETLMFKFYEKKLEHPNKILTLIESYLLDWKEGVFYFLKEDLLSYLKSMQERSIEELTFNKHPQVILQSWSSQTDKAKKINPGLELQIRGHQLFIQKGFFTDFFYYFKEEDLHKEEDSFFHINDTFYYLPLDHLKDFKKKISPFFSKKNHYLNSEDQALEIIFFCQKNNIPIYFNQHLLQEKKIIANIKDDLSKKIESLSSNFLQDLHEGFFLSERDYFLIQLFKNKKNKHLFSDEFKKFLGFFKEFEEFFPEEKNPSPTLEENLLRDYQKEGVLWLLQLTEKGFGAILGDDMGLGKTRQVLFFLKYSTFKKILIVTPMSLLFHWKEEISTYLPDRSLCFYHGLKREYKDEDILLTSYQIFRKEEENLSDRNFSIIIFDEIQFLKNESSKTTKVAKNFPGIKIGLTGTPFENHLQELVTLVKICLPFLSIQKKEPFLLKKIIQPFLLRRKRDHVLKDLPSKQEQYIYLEFSPKEQSSYDQLNSSLRKVLEEENQSIEILKIFTKLRLACLYQQNMSTKIEFLKEQISSLEDKKVLIFSQFTSFLDILQQHFPNSLRLDGTMDQKKREEMVNKFKSSSQSELFLISLKAGGQGLNLQEASYVFLMDPWWNPAVEDQAIGRSYRLGQQNFVHVFKPIIKGSIEEKVLLMKEDKKILFDHFLEGFHEGEGLESFIKELKNTL